ncbi:MAG TPA: hypothetical protein ENJ15_02705 [Caldithrix abyssi]|uniref:Uncharacterized protein n=1 Tax=Caldithrix abyssi TaxID=187145 RepID=A0A7V5VEF3_CALAY|nr:hypothetical protein [Caldithrix abyssi]
MAEQSKKTYMTAQEFVDSWEKEIYELTFLDYFTYLLINELSSAMENDYFKKMSVENIHNLHTHEITSLAFAIADSLQSFLEKNCFGGCALGCPNKLSTPFSPEEDQKRIEFVTMEFDGIAANCLTREECFHHDVMTYVVADTIIDFYNFEIGLQLEEGDEQLKKLNQFVMNVIIRFIHKNGPELLTAPNELAGDLFDEVLDIDDKGWEDTLLDNPGEDEESETWKYKYLRVDYIFDSFLEEHPELMAASGTGKILRFFKNYLNDYIALDRMDIFDMDDFDEFLSLILPQQLLAEDDISVPVARDLFYHLFDFIDQSAGTRLLEEFDRFVDDKFSELERSLGIVRAYQQEKPLIRFLLSDEAGDPNLREGYFEISHDDAGGFILYDIHLKNYHTGVQMPLLGGLPIRKGDIIQGQLMVREEGCRLVFLDMLYPANSRYYLF